MIRVVKYEADWCQPCKVMEKTMQKVLPDYEGKVEYIKRNIENEEVLALVEKHSVRSIPTIVIVDDEENELDKVIGMRSEQQVRNLLNDHVK